VSEPTFSVILPAYNAERTVASSIRSVLAQTRGDFELVIVDDGSTDGTAAVIEPFLADRRLRLVRQENRGLARARNAGIEVARGRYVSFIDSDDLYLPSYLEAYGGALDADPQAAFAYGDSWALEDDTRRIRRKSTFSSLRPPVPPPSDLRAFMLELLERNFISVMATTRRSVLVELGGHNPSFRQVEDYELWLRVVARGYRPVHVPGLHSIVRDRPDSLKKSHARMYESLSEAYRLVAEDYPDVPADLRAIARARMESAARQAARARDGGRRVRAQARARAHAVRVKGLLLRRWRYHDPPPAEIAAAFPDLSSV
jgi:glycosyltransferase involved in cell wall biosynthesis